MWQNIEEEEIGGNFYTTFAFGLRWEKSLDIGKFGGSAFGEFGAAGKYSYDFATFKWSMSTDPYARLVLVLKAGGRKVHRLQRSWGPSDILH